jgi:heme o synthase
MKKNIFYLFVQFAKLTKPRITVFVTLTSIAGYVLAGGRSLPQAIALVVGSALACAGAAVLNEYLERDMDGKMNYTKDRPLPIGSIDPLTALNIGIILIAAGMVELYLTINLLTAFLNLLSAFIYIVIYTPMKRLSALCTSLGAIAGSLPPVAGWTAASGKFGLGAGLLFLVLFIWQHPHFYAIARLHRDDYETVRFKFPPIFIDDDQNNFNYFSFYAAALLAASLLPALSGVPAMGQTCVVITFLSGLLFWVLNKKLTTNGADDKRSALLLLKASVVYLFLLNVLYIWSALR